MKKLVLAMAILFGASLVSCNNGVEANNPENDSTAVDTTVVVDSVAADSVVAQ